MTFRMGLYSEAGSLIGASAVAVGPRGEGAQERAHGAVARRDGAENARERPSSRPPELVGVGVDHPVGAVLRRRQSRHAGHPLVLAQIVPRLADEMEVALARVSLENVRRPVDRVVVGRDDEVRARVQVEGEPLLDDVGLVAREECHDEGHRGRSVRRPERRSSSAATRASARTMPSICASTETSPA
jgi:hypothetical protein